MLRIDRPLGRIFLYIFYYINVLKIELIRILYKMDSDIKELFEEKLQEGFFNDYKNNNILVMTFETNSIDPENLYIDIELDNYLKINPKIQQLCERKIDNFRFNFLRKYLDKCYLLFLWDIDKDHSLIDKTMKFDDLNRWLFVPISRKTNEQHNTDKEFNQLISPGRIIIPEPSEWTNGIYDDNGYFEDLVLIGEKYMSLDKLLQNKEFETTNNLLDLTCVESGSISYEGGFEINNICDIRFYLKDSNEDPIICPKEDTTEDKFKNWIYENLKNS